MIRSQDIFGAEIQYFRTEPRYWEPILEKLKDTGLRCVTTYVQWGTHLVGPPDKKNPAGVLDFTGKTDPRLNLHKFLDLVEKHGLNLNFRSGPFCCNEMVHGGYPPWLVLGDPNMMVWDWQNRTTQGYWIGRKEGSQPSYLHPAYLEWCAKWLAEVDPIIVPHLKVKGGCVTMINLDNEISYIVRDSFLDSDYNPVNVQPGGFWHQFLKQKYGAAKNLPYGHKYGAIEDVPAPRAIPESIGGDLAWYTDWMAFKTWCMCKYIRALREMHEKNGVRGVHFMTNFNPHLPEGVPTRMPDFEAATGGIAGYDFYRGTFMSYSGYQSMARVLKLMNNSLKYTWSAEFMAGTWNKVLNGRVSDDHMRFMARCALAQGCKALAWFMFHDRDCWGDAPVSSHGHTRPSLDVLREIPEILFSKIDNWDALVPQMDVAVVYDLIQHQHASLGDPMPCNDNDLPIGKPAVEGVPAGKASTEYLGLFRLIEENGLQAGAVDILAAPAKLAAYPLVFLPGSPMIEAAAAKALEGYVNQGGTLVISGAWPTLNENGGTLAFFGKDQPKVTGAKGEKKLGKGALIWFPDWLAQDKAEEENLAAIAAVGALLTKCVRHPHVRITPTAEVKWVDWAPGGGHREFRQPRNLGSAIIHVSLKERILFVLNHYPEAARFALDFGKQHRANELVDLSTGEIIPVKGNHVELDIDRKCGEIYRIV